MMHDENIFHWIFKWLEFLKPDPLLSLNEEGEELTLPFLNNQENKEVQSQHGPLNG